ncbi:MAG: hypothetical protein OEV58_16465 [Gammaproteobacteria bacterium]|nr:hypothetical protein [Gammaproteobacteria bacterium]
MNISGAFVGPRYRQSVRLGAALLMAVLGLTSTTAVAYWEVIPEVDAGATYEDNPRYLSDSSSAAAEAAAPGIADDAMGVFVDTRLNVSYLTPGNEIRITPQVRKTDYLKSNADLNSDLWLVNLLATHKDQRGSVGISASYRETGVRNSEYESATPEDPNAPPGASGGSGRFAGDDTQTTKDVQPFLSYTLSPRNTVELSFSASDAEYEQNINPNLPPDLPQTRSYFDYTYEQTVLAINHYLNDKNFLQIALNGGSFNSEQPDSPFTNSTDSFGVNAAYNVAITPTLSANAKVGVTRSSVELKGLSRDPLTGAFCPEDALCSASDDDRNFLGDIGLRKRSELTSLNFNVSRSLAPSSNGTEVVRDQFRFYVDRTLTQRLNLGAAAIYSEETAVAGPDRAYRTYLTVDTTVRWRLTETLSTYGTFTYVSNKYDVSTANSEATNNRLYVGFSYRGVGFRR